jgi:hypothetical protein
MLEGLRTSSPEYEGISALTKEYGMYASKIESEAGGCCSCRDGRLDLKPNSASATAVNLATKIIMRSHALHDTVTDYDISVSDHTLKAVLSVLTLSQHFDRVFCLKAAACRSTTNQSDQYSNSSRQNKHQQEA